jgi:Tfp pilus assembly protein PilO
MARKSQGSTLMKRRWVTPVGFGVVLLVFAVCCGVPYFMSLSRLNGEISQFRAKIDNGGKQNQELRDLAKQSQVLKMEVARYDKLVPATQDKSDFYERVSEAQLEAGLVDVNRSTLAPNPKGRCTALPMELKITSKAKEFHDFLEKLENLPRRSAVSKLNIEADQDMQGLIRVEMTLSIFTITPTKDLPKQ